MHYSRTTMLPSFVLTPPPTPQRNHARPARFWALFTKTAVRNMPLSGKARLLLAAALLQPQGPDAFLAKCFHPPPATHAALLQRQGADALLGKCFHTHTATHAAYAPNTTPVDITALNTTQSDCVELVRVRPWRVPICNMLSEPVVMQLGALVTARVLLQCSLVVYNAVRRINDDEFKQYFIIWEDGWGCRAEAATPGKSRLSVPTVWTVRADVCLVLQEAAMHYPDPIWVCAVLAPLRRVNTDWNMLLEYAAALLFPLNSFRDLVPSEQWQILSVAFPTDFPVLVCAAASSRWMWCANWETLRTRKIKLAMKLRTTGNKEDEEDARELIMEACTRIDWNMDENCDGNSCAIVTVGDIFLVMVACATPVEWAHLPFFPSYDLGLPGSPFLISGLLSTVVYAYLFKREADEGAAGSLVARDRSKEINEDEKQKENEKTEDKYGKQPAEDREDLDDPDGAGEL